MLLYLTAHADPAKCLHAQGIEKEYAELDTVWFMAGSLFKSYPYDVPTEAFSLDLFRQVLAASGSWRCPLCRPAGPVHFGARC